MQPGFGELALTQAAEAEVLPSTEVVVECSTFGATVDTIDNEFSADNGFEQGVELIVLGVNGSTCILELTFDDSLVLLSAKLSDFVETS